MTAAGESSHTLAGRNADAGPFANLDRRHQGGACTSLFHAALAKFGGLQPMYGDLPGAEDS